MLALILAAGLASATMNVGLPGELRPGATVCYPEDPSHCTMVGKGFHPVGIIYDKTSGGASMMRINGDDFYVKQRDVTVLMGTCRVRLDAWTYKTVCK